MAFHRTPAAALLLPTSSDHIHQKDHPNKAQAEPSTLPRSNDLPVMTHAIIHASTTARFESSQIVLNYTLHSEIQLEVIDHHYWIYCIIIMMY